jgi:hypothetical protein
MTSASPTTAQTDGDRKRAPGMAAFLLATTVTCGIVGMMLFPLTVNTDLPGGWGVTDNAFVNWFNAIQSSLITPLTAGLFGMTIVRRQAGNRIGWLLLLVGLGSALSALGGHWSIFAYYTVDQPLPSAQLAGWITNWMWVVVFTLLLLMLQLFPDGSFLSRRWGLLLLGSLSLFTFPMWIGAMIETPMSSAFKIPSPFTTVHPEQLYDLLFATGVAFMPITAVLTLTEILFRFRDARGIERQQIKWLLAGMALLVLMVVIGLTLGLGLGNPLGDILVNASSLAPLIGIGIAMLRHRLYDIDIFIRRTLVYALLTATLLLIYFGNVVLLQRLFGLVTGQKSTLAIVLSTLLIAALFNPLRRRMQRLIERRFYRRRYNAERVLERFAATSRNEVDLDSLKTELRAVVRETMLPVSVSVWINSSREQQW